MRNTMIRLKNKLTHPFNGVRGLWYKHFNRWKFRFLGVELGFDSDIRNKVYLQIEEDETVSIGDHFALYSGDNLSPFCHNTYASICVYPHAHLSIGHHSGMSGGMIWATDSITIGNYVNIGGNCSIIDGDIHNLSWQQRRKDRQEVIPYNKAAIVIEDDVLIGANCNILKGVHIGARSIIGAGSVVTKDIPADCIAAGNPCRIIKSSVL